MKNAVLKDILEGDFMKQLLKNFFTKVRIISGTWINVIKILSLLFLGYNKSFRKLFYWNPAIFEFLSIKNLVAFEKKGSKNGKI